METMKGILMPEEIIQEIQEIANEERRSFTRQVLVILEEALKIRKEKGDSKK
jgi:hypothetical protein